MALKMIWTFFHKDIVLIVYKRNYFADDCIHITLKRKWTMYRSVLPYRLNVENTIVLLNISKKRHNICSNKYRCYLGLFKFRYYGNKCICNIHVYITVHEHLRFAAPKQSVCVACMYVCSVERSELKEGERKQDNINIGRCRYGWRPISISFPCHSIFVCKI